MWDSVGGELQTYNVAGSVVFGPKLGSFYNNLNGNFDSVTMDLWFTRTMTRIGGVATKQDLKGIQKTAKSMLETIDWASVEGRGVYLLAFATTGRRIVFLRFLVIVIEFLFSF